jgi:hypothetical protein
MPAVFANDRAAIFLNMFLNCLADIAQVFAGSELFDAEPQRLKGHFREPFRLNAGLAHKEHSAGVTVEFILDDSDVDIQNVARFQLPFARYAVTNDVIDRGTDRFRETPVIQGCRDRALGLDDVLVANLVQFACRDTRLHVLSNHIQDVGGKSARHAHFVLLGRRFNRYIH